jgi:serine/threonine protein kinase
MLSDAGFLAPAVVAAGQVGRHSVLVTEEVTDARSIYKYLTSTQGDESLCTLQERRELLRSLGRTIGRMHRAGIVHGDLRPGNVQKDRDAGSFSTTSGRRSRALAIPVPQEPCPDRRCPSTESDGPPFFHAYMP